MRRRRQRLRSWLRPHWRTRRQRRSVSSVQRLPEPCELLLVLNHAILNTQKGGPARKVVCHKSNTSPIPSSEARGKSRATKAWSRLLAAIPRAHVPEEVNLRIQNLHIKPREFQDTKEYRHRLRAPRVYTTANELGYSSLPHSPKSNASLHATPRPPSRGPRGSFSIAAKILRWPLARLNILILRFLWVSPRSTR